MGKDDRDIVLFQVHRSFSMISKRLLNLLEDLQNEHQIHFRKLKQGLPLAYESLIDQADYFSDDKYSYLRKKVFDITGDVNRELQNEMLNYKMEIEHENERESG